jgi:electron transfer flavoprotein beta subunit
MPIRLKRICGWALGREMGYHIVVCIKAVMVQAPVQSSNRSADSLAFNPFDWPALEMALRIKEDRGGTVTALSMGPECSAFVLHEARAMGVDRTVLLSDPALAGSDTLATSTALAGALTGLTPFDLVLFGARTSDSDTGQVGPQTAVQINLPLVTWVNKITWKEEGLLVERRADGFVEEFEVVPPAAFTVDPRAVEARDLDLAGIQRAFEQGHIERWSLADIGLSPKEVGLAGSPTVVISWKRAKRKRTCRFMAGTAEEQVETLLTELTASGAMRE